MPRVRILTDSTADVPADIVDCLEIAVVPAYIQIGGQSLRDGEQLSRSEFYAALSEAKEVPTTAVPPASDFERALRCLDGQVDAVVAVLVSSALSGMLNSARLGSAEVPELDVRLVDSGQVTMGLGWQAVIAAEAAAQGQGVEDIVALIQQLQPRIRVLAVLDTLEYLRRSGRVAWARATAARMLRVKPLIDLRWGQATLLGQVRTRRRAVERLAEMVAALGPLERLAVLHTGAPDLELFRANLADLYPSLPLLVSQVGPIVGAHIGPRALGVAAVVAA